MSEHAANGNGTRLDPQLVAQLQKLLNQARVLPEASAAQFNSIGRVHPTSRPPRSSGPAVFDQIAQRARHANSNRQLRETIDFAQEQIRFVTHSPNQQPETADQFHSRLIGEYVGIRASVVADRERIHVSLVYRVRLEAGRDPQGRTHEIPLGERRRLWRQNGPRRGR